MITKTTIDDGRLKELHQDIEDSFKEAKYAQADARLYFRILVQLVLQYGSDGVLKIDNSLGEQASALAAKCSLEIGGGQINFFPPRGKP